MLPPTLKTALLAFMESGINQALQLDPGAISQLSRLKGKIIQLNCTSPSLELYIAPHEQGVSLLGHYEYEADTRISGTATALLKLATSDYQARVLLNEEVNISGDLQLSQRLQQIMTDLELDWEGKLAEFIGDIPAHALGNSVRDFSRWSTDASKSMLLNLEEYLHEEARALPPRAELDHFYQEIEQLSQDTERFAAKLKALKMTGDNTTQ